MTLNRIVFAACTLTFALSACGGGSSAGSTTATTPAMTTATTTTTTTSTDPLPAVYSRFKSNVRVYRSGNDVVVESNGVPNHGSPYFTAGDTRYEAYSGSNLSFQLAPNRISAQTLVFRFPVTPTVAASKTQTPLGPIGVSLNGVPFFNQYAAGRAPLTGEVNGFDQYNGHPQQSGMYHYHVEPLFLTASEGKEGLLGFLLDGYPVYGPREFGATVAESQLDAYHGHTHATPEYPAGTYHYHVTANDPYINGAAYYGTPGTVTQ
jgi:hypothetical protein